jgi:signal recognition particle subunit SRP54
MLVGLQGSGKTTAASKLAYLLKQENHHPLLVACDVYRPAAADQLQTLGEGIGVRVYRHDGANPVDIAREGVQCAIDNLCDVVIIDTAGRLHVDDEMMEEAANIKEAVKPDQILMVIDAMTGQDVVNVAKAFAEKVDFDGVIMSKMDGDARGGGALSVRAVTGKPIKFISSGEKPNSLEAFHPDRMAKRILGMGDMVSLIESAVKVQKQEEEAEATERLRRMDLNMNDFIDMNRQIRKMGGVSKLVSALPGGDRALAQGQVDESALDDMEVIINSMTKAEREKPDLINGSRRKRIAAGAGVTVTEVNQLMKKYADTRRMVKKMYANVAANENMTRGRNKKGKKGEKGKKGRRGGRMAIPGMPGMSMSDLRRIQSMLDDQSK